MCGLIPALKDADEAKGFRRGYALGWHPCRRGYRVSVVMVTPCAHRGWRRTDGFRLVALVLRAERDMRKVFRTLVARNVILVSHCRLLLTNSLLFPGISITQERCLWPKPKP